MIIKLSMIQKIKYYLARNQIHYLLICLYLLGNLLPQTVDGWITTLIVAHNLNSLKMSMFVDAGTELSLMLVAALRHH